MKNLATTFTFLIVFSSVAALAQNAGESKPAAPQGNAENGKKLFVSRGCWSCHGYAAQGGAMNENATGPRLTGRNTAWPAFAAYVRHPAGNMIPYTEKVIPDKELADIYAWIKSIPPPPPVSSLPQFKD